MYLWKFVFQIFSLSIYFSPLRLCPTKGALRDMHCDSITGQCVHALRFGDAVYDVANALRKRFSCADESSNLLD